MEVQLFSKVFKLMLLLMKINGYICHSSSKQKNDQIDTENLSRKQKKINIPHFAYSIALLVFKFGCPLLYFLIVYSESYRNIIGFTTFSFVPVKRNESNVSSIQALEALFNYSTANNKTYLTIIKIISEALFYLQFIMYQIYFIFLSSFTDFIHESNTKFNKAENVIIQSYQSYNHRNTSKNKLTYKKQFFKRWFAFYSVLTIIFLIVYIFYLEKLYQFSNSLSKSVYSSISNVYFVLVLFLHFIDLATLIYFVSKFALMSSYQFKAFSRYLKAVISDANDMKDSCKINIEEIRLTYNVLVEYVNEIESWIKHIAAALYLTSLPSISCFCYLISLEALQSIEIDRYLIMMFIFLFELITLTTICVSLNFNVSLFLAEP
jgi:hypothetical protein